MRHNLRIRPVLGVMILGPCAGSGAAIAQEKGGEGETGTYEVVEGRPHTAGHPGWTWGSQGGVFAETPNRVIILQRGELPVPEKAPEGYTGGYGAFGQPATQGKPRLENCILIVDADGKLIESWTQWDKLFAGGSGPHKVRITPYDPQKHTCILPPEANQSLHLSHTGK